MNYRDNHLVAQDFRNLVKEALPPEQIDAIIAALHETETLHPASYTATGAVGGFLFYMHVALAVDVGFNQQQFDGDAGGLFGFGAGRLDGQLRSADFDRLWKTTESFQVSLALPWANILFFDGGSNLLGNFNGVSAGTQTGVGGGRGGWKLV
jgi:hypothetical protein